MKDFFISYNQADRQWAEWIGWQLEEEGYSVIIQAWDIRPGSNFVIEMQKAAVEAERTVAVLSPDYLNAVYTQPEWAAAFAVDPTGSLKKLVPVRVRGCDPQGLLKSIVYIDLVGLSEEEARQELCSGIKTGRAKPVQAPGFPGVAAVRTVAARPVFPRTPAFMVSTSKLPVTGKDLFGREKELEILDKAWLDPHTHLVTFVAWGGVGKSALVNYWLNLMAKQDYGGAKRIYGWSFYSQGAEAGKQASADEFMQTALAWFGDPDPAVGGAVEKARRLVELIRREPTLLVLDGLEPLQYPPGELHGFDGRLKDQGMKVLLKELAVSQPGLCVITTREALADLADKVEHTVKEVCLEHLSDEAGAQLLCSLRVTGAEKELVQAVREYDGHALALTLLGNYLHSVYQGDIRKRDRIPGLTLERKKGWQAQRMMAAYEVWWGEAPEVNILRLLGLFDRPAPDGAIKALTAAPAIPGLTEKLQGLSGEGMQWALSNLREAGLVAKAGHKPGAKAPDTSAASHSIGTIGPIRPISPIDTIETIDSHPLIREYFGAKLREENPEGWKAAHTRLYDYYKSVPEKEYPETLLELEPLFAAITHGCAAGLHQEALDEVYRPRIKREEEAYTVKKLGAFGLDLAALSHFFEKPWSQPATGLSDFWKASVFNWAGFRLRAMGRLLEAIKPFEAGLKASISQEDWRGAAEDAGNLSKLLLTLGRVEEAITYAQQGVTHADFSGDGFQKETNRTTLADALHQFGKVSEAEQLFRETEVLQQERQPQHRYLYSLRGFQFCDLLLGQGHYQEVMEREEAALKIAQKNGWLLAVALDTLTLGRAWMMQGLEPGNKHSASDLQKAHAYLHQAVEGLRKGNRNDYLPRGLLARAEYYRVQKDYVNAWQDLNEAFEIAELGSMKLYIADYHLEAGRLCRAEGKENEAAEHFRVAKALIDEMGYWRRKEESLITF